MSSFVLFSILRNLFYLIYRKISNAEIEDEISSQRKGTTMLFYIDYQNNPANYFNNRKRVLAKGMPEEKLKTHFEFIAYPL